MLFQKSCAGCSRVGFVLCRTCRFALAAPPQPIATSNVIAAVPFAGRARDVLLGFKYGNRRQLSHHFAGLLVNQLLRSGVDVATIDVVTWAPTSSTRRYRRGFDQAEVVARRLAAQLGLPCRKLLERERTSGPQTGRARAERLLGPKFRAHRAAAGQRILVIDDISTTGATLRAADAALGASGAANIIRAAVASTPAGIHRHHRPGSTSHPRKLATVTPIRPVAA